MTKRLPSPSSRDAPAPGDRACRRLDVTLALLAAVLLSPLLLLAWLLVRCRVAVVQRIERRGRGDKRFDELSLVLAGGDWGDLGRSLWLGWLPTLWNVWRGEMAFVGPRPLSPQDLLWEEPDAAERLRVPPGMVSLWQLRRRSNIDYGTELATDAEYIAARSAGTDCGILLRGLWSGLWGESPGATAEEVRLLGLRIDNLTMADAVEAILAKSRGDEPAQVCFVNADCANIAWGHEEYRRVLRQAPLVLADGIGMKLAGKMLRQPIRQNVNGTDLFPRLCQAVSGTGLGIFLLGARPGVAEGVREWVREHYPQAEIRGVQHGYFTPDEEEDVLRRIRGSGAEILLAAFGAPRQDLWLARVLPATGAKAALGVGGLFDYYSGRIPRSPQWVRELCLEWLYRVYQEPGRLWKRYFLGNGVFLWRVLRVRLRGLPLHLQEQPATPAPPEREATRV